MSDVPFVSIGAIQVSSNTHTHTKVGIRNPDAARFQMVETLSILEWSGFHFKWVLKTGTVKTDFQMVKSKMVAFITSKSFTNRPLKNSVFKCFRFSKGRISDPYCR